MIIELADNFVVKLRIEHNTLSYGNEHDNKLSPKCAFKIRARLWWGVPQRGVSAFYQKQVRVRSVMKHRCWRAGQWVGQWPEQSLSLLRWCGQELHWIKPSAPQHASDWGVGQGLGWIKPSAPQHASGWDDQDWREDALVQAPEITSGHKPVSLSGFTSVIFLSYPPKVEPKGRWKYPGNSSLACLWSVQTTCCTCLLLLPAPQQSRSFEHPHLSDFGYLIAVRQENWGEGHCVASSREGELGSDVTLGARGNLWGYLLGTNNDKQMAPLRIHICILARVGPSNLHV